MDDVMIYTDRRAFLVEAASSTKKRFIAKMGEEEWFGLAGTEHQFRKALCEAMCPVVETLSRNSMQRLMAEELKVVATD